jgi:hypothetical protein
LKTALKNVNSGNHQDMGDLSLEKKREHIQEKLHEIDSIIYHFGSSYLSIQTDAEISASVQMLYIQHHNLQEILEDHDVLEE